jgi:outer membrane autotransporter protein
MIAVSSQGQSLVIDDGNSPFRLASGDTLSVSGGAFATSDGVLEFGISTDGSGAPVSGLLATDTVTLEQGAGIHLVSEVGAMDLDLIYTVMLIEADTNIFLYPTASVTNRQGTLSAGDFDLQNQVQLVQSNYLMETRFYFSDSDLFVDFGRVSLANSAGFDEGSDLWEVADYIDNQAGTSPEATAQVNILNTLTGEQQEAQLRQLYETELPHHSHLGIIRSGVDIVGSRSVSFRSARRHERSREQSVPEGSFGLHLKSQPARPWTKAYASHGSRIEEGDYDSYNHNMGGGIIGIDKGYGNLLIGAAGGVGFSHMSSSLNDKSYADMAYGVLYASLGTERWFASTSASFGTGTAETESGTGFDTTGDFNMDAISLYLGIGREIWLPGEGAVFTPEAGVRSSLYRQDAYTESATTAVPRSIDAYEHWSVRPTLGMTVSWPYEEEKFRCEPRIRAFWTGELNKDADEVDYTLVGDTEVHTLYVRGSEPQFFTFGAGAAFIRNDGWEFALDMDSHFGELSALSVSLKTGYMF